MIPDTCHSILDGFARGMYWVTDGLLLNFLIKLSLMLPQGGGPFGSWPFVVGGSVLRRMAPR